MPTVNSDSGTARQQMILCCSVGVAARDPDPCCLEECSWERVYDSGDLIARHCHCRLTEADVDMVWVCFLLFGYSHARKPWVLTMSTTTYAEAASVARQIAESFHQSKSECPFHDMKAQNSPTARCMASRLPQRPEAWGCHET